MTAEPSALAHRDGRVRSALSTLRNALSSPADALSLVLQTALYVAVKPLSRYWARDPSLWAFGAREGEAFVDNAKYLYLHVAAERPDVRPVWLSKDRETVAELRANGFEAYHCYSFRGVLVTLRAGVVFLTQGFRDAFLPCYAGATIVQLWHGIPLKRIAWDAEFPDASAPVRAAHAYLAGEYDLLTVPGEGAADAFESGLLIERDRTVATGYPRNDALFGELPGEDVGTDPAALARVRDLAADGPLVFYLPTFRDWDDGAVGANVDFAALDAFLADRGATLVVKTHPKEGLDLSKDDLSRIVQLPEATDVYPLLRYADVLLTDYSSVYFDFLLLDRPIAFYPYDLDRYRGERGFYIDYEDAVVGPRAGTFEDLLDALDRALDAAETGDDPDADRRRDLRETLFDDPTPDQSRAAAVYEAVRKRTGSRENEA